MNDLRTCEKRRSSGGVQFSAWLWHRLATYSQFLVSFATKWQGLVSLGREPQVIDKHLVKPRKGRCISPRGIGNYSLCHVSPTNQQTHSETIFLGDVPFGL